MYTNTIYNFINISSIPDEIIYKIYLSTDTIYDFINIGSTTKKNYQIMENSNSYLDLNSHNFEKNHIPLLLDRVCYKDSEIFPLVLKTYNKKFKSNINNILENCCKYGSIKNVNYLLNNYTFSNEYLKSLYSLVCYSNNLELIKQFTCYADVTTILNGLSIALFTQNTDTVKYLSKYIKKEMKFVMTEESFQYAINNDLDKIVKLYVYYDIEYINRGYKYYIEECARFDSYKSMKILIERYKIGNNFLEKCLLLAFNKNSYCVINYIFSYINSIKLYFNIWQKLLISISEFNTKITFEKFKYLLDIYFFYNKNNLDVIHSIDFIYIFCMLSNWWHYIDYLQYSVFNKYNIKLIAENYKKFITFKKK